MRIACCISALLLAGACSDPRAPQERQPPAPSQGSPAPSAAAPAPAAAARTSRIEFPTAHGPLAIDVETDDTIAPGSAPRRVEVIAEMPQRAVVLVDRYASLPGGLSMCQAGEESFVRVIAIGAAQPRVTFTAKTGSCLQNIELADPGLEWSAGSRTLRIEWLANAAGAPQTQEIIVSADGTVSR
jgi:hypothetical protein